MSTATAQEVACPKCGGRMFDNRTTKRNPKAPDFKCRDRSCDGVIWPPRAKTSTAAPQKQAYSIGTTGIAELDEQDAHEDATIAAIQQGSAEQSPAKARLGGIFKLQEACFAHACLLAKKAETEYEVPATLEGVSALTAQALIAFREHR